MRYIKIIIKMLKDENVVIENDLPVKEIENTFIEKFGKGKLEDLKLYCEIMDAEED